jgi:hypothetical protein
MWWATANTPPLPSRTPSARPGLPVVARLKENLPLLAAAMRARFDDQPPHAVFQEGQERVEVWDYAHFDSWETLDWPEVRVLCYRQHKSDGSVIQAEWLTNFPVAKPGSLSLYRVAKSRWEIENRGLMTARTVTAWSTSATTSSTAP